MRIGETICCGECCDVGGGDCVSSLRIASGIGGECWAAFTGDRLAGKLFEFCDKCGGNCTCWFGSMCCSVG